MALTGVEGPRRPLLGYRGKAPAPGRSPKTLHAPFAESSIPPKQLTQPQRKGQKHPVKTRRSGKGIPFCQDQPQWKGHTVLPRPGAVERARALLETSHEGDDMCSPQNWLWLDGAMDWDVSGIGMRGCFLGVARLFLESGGFSKGACFFALRRGAGVSPLYPTRG